jgi:molybdopterin-guanine dinucleotide biosynthesis protein B
LNTKAAVIGVVGHKNSGKTTVIEIIVQELINRGYLVATAKHVKQKAFSIDTKGKDTWKHAAAGANPVLSVSEIETAVLIKDGAQQLSVERMRSLAPEADIIMMEGFSWLVLKDEHLGKILCIRNKEEYKDFKRRTRGKVIASCSIHPMGQPILSIDEDAQILVEQAVKYVKRKRKISKILSRLPGLDCGKCGHFTCEEMAVAIYGNKAKLSDCFTLKQRSKLKTRVIVNGTEIPLQPFVSEIIRKSLLGMVSSLKGTSIKGNEEVCIQMLSPEKRSGET